VDKNNFIGVLNDFSKSSEKQAQEILSLKQHYPYSQLLHALSARVSKDHGFSNQQHELQLAAVYACDRGVLKEIMTLTINDDKIVNTAVRTGNSQGLIAPVVETETDQSHVADDVIHDLERLHELKHNFEALFSESTDTNDQVVVKKEIAQTEGSEDNTVKLKSGLSKKERIIALAKEADARAEAEAKERELEAKATPPTKKKEKSIEGLIDEIANTKKEIDPETEKQKQQIEIIDQFIKAQPSIVNSKDKPMAAPSGDLSTIKSGEFGNNIVSETLVDILIKQGKKEKAVEVLKKLIWKFPQKKAYFAAQIEELKN